MYSDQKMAFNSYVNHLVYNYHLFQTDDNDDNGDEDDCAIKKVEKVNISSCCIYSTT